MKLNDYVLYEENIDVSNILERLSRQLKIIHNNGLVISNLNSNDIVVDDDYSFTRMNETSNFQQEKEQNIKSLGKIMIGLCLSKQTNFRDFSNVDDSWFIENLDNISSVINEEYFDKEYIESLFSEKKEYFCDYVDEKRRIDELNGKSNTQSYKKVLRTAASDLYQDASDEDLMDIKEKSALISTMYNPVLLLVAGFIIMIFLVLIALIN